MDSIKHSQQEQLKKMWIALMIEAKQIGITKDQVQEFISQYKGMNEKDTNLQ